MRKISIQQGLREVKLLNSKIQDVLLAADFVTVKEKAVNTVGGRSVADYNKDAKAKFQQVNDLISNYTEIKQKIAESNAVTTVEIAGKQFSVAAAIEKKSSISNDRALLSLLQRQYADAQRKAQQQEQQLTAQADGVAKVLLADKDVYSDDYKQFVDNFIKERQPEFVDPLHIADQITVLKNFIETFLAEVDYRLTESNVTTFIEVTD